MTDKITGEITAIANAPLSSIKWASFQAYLQLMRPANIITAWADVLAGGAAGFGAAGIVLSSVLLSGAPAPEALTNLRWLLLATTGLYGGGVTL